jgi:hypothetical protein
VGDVVFAFRMSEAGPISPASGRPSRAMTEGHTLGKPVDGKQVCSMVARANDVDCECSAETQQEQWWQQALVVALQKHGAFFFVFLFFVLFLGF